MNPSFAFTRRQMLQRSGTGFGMLGLAGVLAQESQAAPAAVAGPLAVKAPHFPAKAKRVIHLFMNGGPSQVDTFDPKPELQRLNGQPLPASFHAADLTLQFMKSSDGLLMAWTVPGRPTAIRLARMAVDAR